MLNSSSRGAPCWKVPEPLATRSESRGPKPPVVLAHWMQVPSVDAPSLLTLSSVPPRVPK
jgi:hypothetical protein